MLKKLSKLSLIFILFIPIFIDGKAMLEENLKREIKKPKSEGIASALSLGTTVIPAGLGFLVKNYYLSATGIIVGPSVGHFYANQWSRGLKSAGLRAGIIAVPVALLIWGDVSQDLGKLLLVFLTSIPATGILAYLTINDIATAPSSVRKYNESIDKMGNVYFVPKIDIKEESYELSVVYCF